VLTDAMITEEATLLKAAEAEEAKTKPLVLRTYDDVFILL